MPCSASRNEVVGIGLGRSASNAPSWSVSNWTRLGFCRATEPSSADRRWLSRLPSSPVQRKSAAVGRRAIADAARAGAKIGGIVAAHADDVAACGFEYKPDGALSGGRQQKQGIGGDEAAPLRTSSLKPVCRQQLITNDSLLSDRQERGLQFCTQMAHPTRFEQLTDVLPTFEGRSGDTAPSQT
jgi:hypothetical protein